jgi:hypothetical protein
MPFEYITGSKPSFAYLKVYGSKAYIFNKYIPKSLKLEPRAHIGYLIGYDSTNIFRIWIPSREIVIRTRDIIFDQDSFYSPKDLDLGAVLTESAENIIEILKLPDFDIERDEIEDIIYDIIIVDIPSEPAILSPEPSNSDSASLANQSTPSLANQSMPFTTPFSIPPAIPIKADLNKEIHSQIDKNNIIQGKRIR